MADNETVMERLIKYLAYKKIKFGRMERMAGFSNGYLRNNKGAISGTKLGEIIECLPDLNGDWLLTGRGEMEFKHEEQTPAVSAQTYNEMGRHARGGNFFAGDKVERDKVIYEEGTTHIEKIVDKIEQKAEQVSGDVRQTVNIFVDGRKIEVDLEALHTQYQKLESEYNALKDKYIKKVDDYEDLRKELEKIK